MSEQEQLPGTPKPWVPGGAMKPDQIQRVIGELKRAAKICRDARKLLPREIGPGTPEAKVAWVLFDEARRLEQGALAWDPPPEPGE